MSDDLKEFDFSEDKIDEAIQSFLSKLPEVKYRQDEFPTTTKLIKIFRDGFKLGYHNLLLAEESVLCYDLMICRNPLDDNKKQEFYTFFSQKGIIEAKEKLAEIYTYYLENDKEKHVDTLLQICYSKKYAQKVRDGFYLDFSEPDRMSLHLLSEPGCVGSVFQWYEHNLDDVKKNIIDKSAPINQTVEEINKYVEERCAAFEENSGFDRYVSCCDESMENSGFDSYVDAFLQQNKREPRKEPSGNSLKKRDIQKNAYLISIINQLAVPGMKYLFFFPVSFPNRSQIGHFVLSTTDDIYRSHATHLMKFKMLSFVLMDPLVQAVVTTQHLRRIEELVVRSSLAQIMARNLSHNYGSHVLNHLLSATLSSFSVSENPPYACKYKTIADLAKETCNQIVFLLKRMSETAPNIWKDEDTRLKIEQLVDSFTAGSQPVVDAKDVTTESLRQVVYLLNHIKCRVDYISDISFGAPMLQTSRFVYNDIFKEIDRVGLLMNHISGLEEDFKYSIVVLGPDGKALSESNDFQVAIPNDVVGTHAFYNIIENIIRNTAKHSSGNKKDVTFYVHFTNIDENRVMHEEAKDEAKRYYCVEIYDDIEMGATEVDALVDNLNKRMNEPIYDKDRPRSHSLGIVEMEASAAYLRKFDSVVINDEQYHVVNSEEDDENTLEKYRDSYDNPDGKLNLLKAFSKDSCLGYRFFMLRPQEVLVVGDNVNEWHDTQKGVWAMSGEKFRKDLENGKVFNHDFVVVDSAVQDFKETETVVEKHGAALSPRILKLAIHDWIEGIKEQSGVQAIDLRDECWAQWDTQNGGRWPLKYFSSGYDPDMNEETAVYKHHLKSEQDKKDIEDEGRCKYAEALSSVAFDKLPGAYKLTSCDDKAIRYVIGLSDWKEEGVAFADCCRNRESVNNKVLVIDERIQDAAEKLVYGKGACVLPFSTFYKKMGVTVPGVTEINLSEKDFSTVKDKLKEYMVNQGVDKDFMLIHYGILERIFKSEDKVKWKEKMDEFLKKLAAREKAPRIVITSGRGVPGKLPEQVCFVSLSSVTYSLIDYKSKYLFNCLLYAARKTNH